jgi:hypothetical protein
MKLVEMVGRFAQASDLGALSESAVDRMPLYVNAYQAAVHHFVPGRSATPQGSGPPPLRLAAAPDPEGPGQPDGGDFSSAWRAWCVRPESLTYFLFGVIRMAAHHSHEPTEPKPPVTLFQSGAFCFPGQRDFSRFVPGA